MNLPANSVIIIEDLHLGSIYTEHNISCLTKVRSDILLISTSRCEMKKYSFSSQLCVLLNYERIDKEDNYILGLLNLHEKIVLSCILSLSDGSVKRRPNFGLNANKKNLLITLEKVKESISYIKARFKQKNISTHKLGLSTSVPFYHNNKIEMQITIEKKIDEHLHCVLTPTVFFY